MPDIDTSPPKKRLMHLGINIIQLSEFMGEYEALKTWLSMTCCQIWIWISFGGLGEEGEGIWGFGLVDVGWCL